MSINDGTSAIPPARRSTFMTPAGYPTHCTPELVSAFGDMLMAGASPRSVCNALALNWKQFLRWYAIGRKAHEDGLGEFHQEAPYLNLYLRIIQCKGAAEVMAQCALYIDEPAKWLAMNPETRNEWGPGGAETLEQAASGTEEVFASTPVRSPQRSREVLRHLIEAGVAIPSGVVEADGVAEVGNSEAQDTDRGSEGVA